MQVFAVKNFMITLLTLHQMPSPKTLVANPNIASITRVSRTVFSFLVTVLASDLFVLWFSIIGWIDN